MAGSDDGPVIVPGDSADSLLYQIQSAGNHPGTFTPEELAQVQTWIDAGAVETAGSPTTSAGPTWDSDVASLVQEKCGTCHSTADKTGLAMDTYADIMAGGADGPVIVPGDSADSLLYQIQSAGGHPGTFTPEELALVQKWIDAGAVENAGAASVPVWDGTIATMLQENCGTCHGPLASGGLVMSSYADIMAGSDDGPVIVPGDSANSLLISIQQAGEHPGQLTPDEIALLQSWIDAGALEK